MNEISYSLFEEKNSRVFLSLGKVNCGSLVGLHTTVACVCSAATANIQLFYQMAAALHTHAVVSCFSCSEKAVYSFGGTSL